MTAGLVPLGGVAGDRSDISGPAGSPEHDFPSASGTGPPTACVRPITRRGERLVCVSNHGVDLLRSDTGHYMEWPGTLTRVATIPAQAGPAQRVRFVPGLPSEDLVEVLPVAPPRAWAYATRDTMDRKTLTLTLVNWMILLALMCGFLLAKTLPADTALGGTVSGTSTSAGVSTTATR